METRTSARMAALLTELGYEVTTGVGGTGVVAVLHNGAGPTVLIRADMDGLPLQEASGLPNASTVRQVDSDGTEKPVMHACGHDVHITALVGTARQMMDRKADWSGTLVLIVQPAEERIFGARAMVNDGLYSRFPKPDYALAFHVNAQMAEGQVSVPLGIHSSSSDGVEIVVHGVGTHGAYPHLGVDPVLVASSIVVNLQSLRSRTVNPLQGAVVTVGSIHGGIKNNIISDRVDMLLTVRADSPEVRTQLLDGIDRVSRGTAIALGVPDTLLPTVTRSTLETTPATINDGPDRPARPRRHRRRHGSERPERRAARRHGRRGFRLFHYPRERGEGRLFRRGRHPGRGRRHRRRPPLAPVQDRRRTLGHHRRRGHDRLGPGVAGEDVTNRLMA
jgi:amidohydrolase